MGLGFKRLFKRKSKADKAVRTPEKVKHVPETPPTQPVKEDPPSHNRRDGQSDDLPVRNLLKELNIQDFDIGTTNSGDTDPVFEDAEFPDDEPAIEPTTLSPKSYTGAPPHGVSSLLRDDDDDEEVDTSSEQTFDSPLRPRNLGSSDLLVKDDDSIIAPVGDQLIEKTQTVGASDEAKYDVTGTIMNMIERARQCASMEPCAGGVRVPKPIQKLVPTADNALLCQPLGGLRQISDLSQTRPKLVRQYSYFDDKFALKFLDELINVGYALVNHQQLVEGATEDEDDWIGRSVTLILRPGICNVLQVQAPYLEWATLGGGQQATVETTAVSLLDVHSIENSTVDDMPTVDDGNRSDDDAEKEDLQCFFTLTTKQGQIYVMEAITADESQRLVAGVKNLTLRLSRLLIAGDNNVLDDFFDNSQEPEDIKVTEEEAMIRISHALLDFMSR